MGELKNPKLAIPVVLMAGIFWSFGPYVVRNIDQAHTVPWQYLFTRGLVIFILLNLYLYLEEGLSFISNYKKIGISGIVGGTGLAFAMITFIWSITNTSAAITLLCLASMPFITALLGFLFLKEKISLNVWVAIFIATIFVYSRLNSDRELIVMQAAGASPISLAKPAIIMAFFAIVIGYFMTLYVTPKSYQGFRNLQWDIRYSFAHVLLKEGVFNSISDKAIWFEDNSPASARLIESVYATTLLGRF